MTWVSRRGEGRTSDSRGAAITTMEVSARVWILLLSRKYLLADVGTSINTSLVMGLVHVVLGLLVRPWHALRSSKLPFEGYPGNQILPEAAATYNANAMCE